MTVYAFGDSHAESSFRGISGVVVCHVGPVTMKRVGYDEDPLMRDSIKSMKLVSSDVVIFCFGEIDIRCWVKVYLDKYSDVRSLLKDWVGGYLRCVGALNMNGAKVVIMSISPPTTEKRADSAYFPVKGTDEERAQYTVIANEILSSGCEEKGFMYLDVYSRYKDGNGMLRFDYSDGFVHIGDVSFVRELLVEKGLLD